MITYERYLDKVYGCFLGKTVAGTMGAPFEGIKMPLELEFKPEMINTMLPNDDLDLQVLWFDAVKKYGADFTSYDLLRIFCENCDYSPGEYAVMRKNFAKGIYPPESGCFCNDFYLQGMAVPSEARSGHVCVLLSPRVQRISPPATAYWIMTERAYTPRDSLRRWSRWLSLRRTWNV